MTVLCIDNRPMITPIADTADTIRAQSHQALPVIVYAADRYNGSVTGDRCCSLNANTGASANHAGPSVVIRKTERPVNKEVTVLMDAYQHHGWRVSKTCGSLTTLCSVFVRGDTPLVVARRKNE